MTAEEVHAILTSLNPSTRIDEQRVGKLCDWDPNKIAAVERMTDPSSGSWSRDWDIIHACQRALDYATR